MDDPEKPNSGLRPAGKKVGAGDDDPYASTAVKIGGQLASKAEQITGEVLADRFELRSELGRGGSGIVYRAFDRSLQMDVAVKLLQAGYTKDPTSVERLRREIIAARKVSHKNVIRINEFVVGDRESFVAMEYLTGGSLSDALEDGRVPIGRGVQIALGLCEGLAAAHEVGVIHRDVKPENVLFDGAGVPKLMDFGLARMSEMSGVTVGFSGTPFYMSPEQGEGKEITTKSDVYSFGVLLFQLFTNSLPFEADSLVRMAVLHAQQAPPAPRSRRPDIPPLLEALILQCLAKDPEVRPSAPESVSRLWEISAMLGDSTSLPRVSFAPAAPARPADRATDPQPPPIPEPPRPIAVEPPPPEPRPETRSRAWLALLFLLIPAGIAIPFATGMIGTPDATPTPVSTSIAEIIELPGSAAPTITQNVVVTVTVTPVATETQVAVAPTPTATTRIVVTPVPGTPTPPPVRMGSLTVRSNPWVDVYVDGTLLGRSTSLRGKAVPAGKHELVFKNPALSYEAKKSVTIAADAETVVQIDTALGTIEVN